MGQSIRLGELHGVAVRAHPSLALVMLWVIYQWGIATHAGLRGMIFGTLMLLSVFTCVLLHELAHALVAVRYGLRVQDIILLPIGGVARVEQVALSPKAESAIALAGPLINLLIAAALSPFVVIVAETSDAGSFVALLGRADDLSTSGFLLYLWLANILLAGFNLLPAFPMDGGRVLRALLTSFWSRLTATRIAVSIGQVLAVLLAVAGVLIGDYLMPLVSAFIFIAAWLEARHVRVEASLKRLNVGQFALWDAGGVRPDEPLAHAIKGGPRDLVVTQGAAVVGMLWRRDILKHLNGDHGDLVVRDIMDRRVTAVEGHDSVYDVHLWMQASHCPAVPVIENGRYQGIFTSERLAHVYSYLGQAGLFPRWTTLQARLRRLIPAFR